jgi:hypothetical protein
MRANLQGYLCSLFILFAIEATIKDKNGAFYATGNIRVSLLEFAEKTSALRTAS